jgi:hypothetical protein
MPQARASYRLLYFASVVCLVLGGRDVMAQTAEKSVLVFSSYSATSPGGDCIAGTMNAGCGTAPLAEWIATPFMPSASGTLAYLDVAAVWINGKRGVVVTLVNDDGGVPGPISAGLESFTAALPKQGAKPNPKVKLTSKLHPALTAGTTYWVVMAPRYQTSLSSWYLSSTDTNDPDFSTSEGATWNSFNSIFGGPNPPYTNLPEIAVYEQ